MIAVDSNLLVYAHREDSPWYDAAYARIVELAEGQGPWAIPWPCIHEFLAIVTHPRIYTPPTPLEKALDQVEAWLESPALFFCQNPRITGSSFGLCFSLEGCPVPRCTMQG
jgi:hypothetical protein